MRTLAESSDLGGPRKGRWRSIVLAPTGDGRVHRRGSDALRVIAAVLALVACELVIRADSSSELAVVRALTPPPQGIRWLVATVWYLGSLGVIAFLVAVALITRNRRAARDVVLAGLGSWALSGILVLTVGATGGRTPFPGLVGVDQDFPLVRIAATVAVAGAAMPYLARGLQRLVVVAVSLAALATVVYGAGLPVSVLGSLALGWGITAGVHLAVGSPTGLPSGAEVAAMLADIGVFVRDVAPRELQQWGAARFRGRDAVGIVDVTLYGRDAHDAQLLGKLWRALVYRDSGPTISLTRLQSVEHEAYVTLLAARAGAVVPEILAAGTAGPSSDAVVVSRPPAPVRLVEAAADTVDDAAAEQLFETMSCLRASRIAHGAVSPDTVVIGASAGAGAGRTGLVDFRRGSSSAPDRRLDRDAAGALASLALTIGPARAVAAARRGLGPDTLLASLPYLHAAALDPILARALGRRGTLVKEVREAGAAAVGAEVPKLAEPRRVSWVNLVLALGTLVGAWALLGVLANVTQSFGTIVGAKWGWVVATFLLAQAVYPSNAVELVGSVSGTVPFGRAVALEVSNSFTSLAAGTMGSLAARVRFFQQQGYSSSLAVSSGVLVSTASWIVKGALFLIALPLALNTIHFRTQGADGSSTRLIWLVVIVVVVVGVALGAVLLVPRLRRVTRDTLRPRIADVVANLRALAHQPRKLVQIFGGCIASQLLVALALGTALHAFGAELSLATLILVLTLGSMAGGVSPVPGGMGVVEAGMILLLTSAGIHEQDAVAAVFVQRLFTAYLPPIWGWGVLVWMRRREYL